MVDRQLACYAGTSRQSQPRLGGWNHGYLQDDEMQGMKPELPSGLVEDIVDKSCW